MTDPAVAPEPEATTVAPHDSEWRVEDLLDLFVRPTRFFSSRQPFLADNALPTVACLVGINSAMGRVEQRMIRADAGGREVGAFITESWIGFWITIILGGLLSALFLWHLGAWWYRVRLRWSGAIEPDRERTRVVYFYSALVWALPALLTQVIDTFRFSDYQASWDHEGIVPALLLVFPFWSFIVSYRGARTVFELRRGPALWWFVIAPTLMFMLALGLFGAIAAGVFQPPD